MQSWREVCGDDGGGGGGHDGEGIFTHSQSLGDSEYKLNIQQRVVKGSDKSYHMPGFVSDIEEELDDNGYPNTIHYIELYLQEKFKLSLKDMTKGWKVRSCISLSFYFFFLLCPLTHISKKSDTRNLWSNNPKTLSQRISKISYRVCLNSVERDKE